MNGNDLCIIWIRAFVSPRVCWEYWIKYVAMGMMTSSNKTVSAFLAICRRNHRSQVNSPHKCQWRGALMFCLICVWIYGWVNSGGAGDLRRYRAHYDVIVMGRLCVSYTIPNRMIFEGMQALRLVTMQCLVQQINSLAPGKFEWNFRYLIFKQILVIDVWSISCEIALIWLSLDFTDDQSTLVQVMAWCLQATSHYLNQCWPRSLSPFGVSRPQWGNYFPLYTRPRTAGTNLTVI